MIPLWEEDPETYEQHYQRCRRELGMTKETITRDVEHLKAWLRDHPHLPSISGGTYLVIDYFSIHVTM